jgi:filamentous hemagglutinin
LATVKASKLNAESLFQSLQVAPHPVRGYRPQVQAYRVLEDIEVPGASVLANPQFGPGGGAQFFIQNFSNSLQPVRKFNLSR